MASSPSRVTIISALARFCLFFLFLILTVGLIHQVLARPKSRSKTYPQMRAGAPFKIAIFADLHYGENGWTDWGPRQDVNSTRVMSTVLDAETPGKIDYRSTYIREIWICGGLFIIPTVYKLSVSIMIIELGL